MLFSETKICVAPQSPYLVLLYTSPGGLDQADTTKAMHGLGLVDLSEESALTAA